MIGDISRVVAALGLLLLVSDIASTTYGHFVPPERPSMAQSYEGVLTSLDVKHIHEIRCESSTERCFHQSMTWRDCVAPDGLFQIAPLNSRQFPDNGFLRFAGC